MAWAVGTGARDNWGRGSSALECSDADPEETSGAGPDSGLPLMTSWTVRTTSSMPTWDFTK